MIRVQKLKQYIVQVRGVSYKPSDVRPSTASDGVVLLKANNIDKNNSINLN